MTIPKPRFPLSILGAGAWGTALAIQLSTRTAVCLWARDPHQAETMRKEGQNSAYLPGFSLPADLQVTSDFDHAVRHGEHGIVMIATPMAGLAETLIRLEALPFKGHCRQVLWLCKGFQEGTAALGHEIARSLSPNLCVGVVSGPSFAQEVAQGQPSALVVASHDPSLRENAANCFHGGNLRVYTSADPIGVEVGGAVKNVLAIATGIADGFCWPQSNLIHGHIGLGMNARAALITRGLAEMSRLGVALGAQASTFMGLSGLGDLVLTSTGHLSRNRQVGLNLAKGKPLEKILAELGHVAEGVRSAPMVLQRAQDCGVDMPITRAVVRVLLAEQNVMQALEELLDRKAGAETDLA